MKILAIKGDRNDTYICEVNHTEVEKHINLYYGNMGRLKEGEEIDLGAGYDFATEARDTLKQTESFFSANKKMLEAISKGINVFRREDNINLPDDK